MEPLRQRDIEDKIETQKLSFLFGFMAVHGNSNFLFIYLFIYFPKIKYNFFVFLDNVTWSHNKQY